MVLVTEMPEVGTTEWHLDPGIVIGSWCVSFIGSVMTVELLHRRSNGNHWRAWVSRLLCAICMGQFAIWSMHYVGNLAIRMGDGSEDVQLNYSAGLTLLSAVTPVVVIVLSLWIADYAFYGKHSDKSLVSVTLVLLGSAMSGCSIVGMHYIGQMAIKNYEVFFVRSFVGGAFAIACGVCTVLLVTFFWFENTFGNDLWKRLIFSVGMAVGVTSMHFQASYGTAYKFKYTVHGSSIWDNKNALVAVILSSVMLVAILCWPIYHWCKRAKQNKKARQVSLYIVWLDPEGRVMLDAYGQLPMRKITMDSNHDCFENEFDIGHSVFHWIYKATHNWPAVRDLIDPMREDLEKNEELKRYSKPTPRNNADHSQESYSRFFRESFCIAADDLATELKCGLRSLGTLYSGVMTTGSSNLMSDSGIFRLFGMSKTPRVTEFHDMESGGIISIDGGQALFLTKRVKKVDMPKYSNMGYKFHSMGTAAKTIQSLMKVTEGEMSGQLHLINDALKTGNEIGFRGAYLACFAIRLDVGSSGWDIVVPRATPHQIPMVKLSKQPLTDKEKRFLNELEGVTLKDCLAKMRREKGGLDESKDAFWNLLENKLDQLMILIREPWFKQAKLFSKSALHVNGPGPCIRGQRNMCDIIAFTWIIDIHYSSLRSDDLMYMPYKFLETMQVSREHGPNDRRFYKEVREEFSSLADRYASHVSLSSTVRERAVRRVSSMAESLRSPKAPRKKTSTSSISLRTMWRNHASNESILEENSSEGSDGNSGGGTVNSSANSSADDLSSGARHNTFGSNSSNPFEDASNNTNVSAESSNQKPRATIQFLEETYLQLLSRKTINVWVKGGSESSMAKFGVV